MQISTILSDKNNFLNNLSIFMKFILNTLENNFKNNKNIFKNFQYHSQIRIFKRYFYIRSSRPKVLKVTQKSVYTNKFNYF